MTTGVPTGHDDDTDRAAGRNSMLDGLLVAPAHPAVPEGDEHHPVKGIEDMTEEAIEALGTLVLIEEVLATGLVVGEGQTMDAVAAELGLPPRPHAPDFDR